MKIILQQLATDAATLAGRAPNLTSGEVEAEVDRLRQEIADVLPDVSAEYGVDGWATVLALKTLAIRLLDLKSLVVTAEEVVTETLVRPASLIALAGEWYGDFTRWAELRELNPDLAAPHALPVGTQVIRRVR
ncbi:MAG TPA: hypothetical protein PLA94_02680 [Myxococcota bacterium]|nr:hypothetical protein [Myxococcota bacterium]